MTSTEEFARAAAVVEIDAVAMAEARGRQDLLTKPAGSLGLLEEIGIRLSGIAGVCPPPVPEGAVVAVFAGDHGVVAEGVTPWPQEITVQMVANFVAGGAAVNVLGRHVGAAVVVVDVGVATDPPPGAEVRRSNVRRGTGNLAVEPAMTRGEAMAAMAVGADLAEELVAAGAGCLLTGDMGIGNTTASAALIAGLTGRPVDTVTGRGTGIDDAMLAIKVGVIERALSRRGVDPGDPIGFLAEVGGLEIAALVGYIVGAAACRVPVLLDGVISAAAAVVATAISPLSKDYLFAGHRSVEPGASAALEHLGLRPILELDLRLGEGTGACLALPILQAAARIMSEMATFESAGISEKGD